VTERPHVPADDVFARWRERREAGEAIDPETLIAAHPDLADDLRRRFAVLPLLDRVAADAWESGVRAGAGDAVSGEPPSGADATEIPATEGLPRRIGDYLLVREIGRGGMGVVYEAEQVSMRRLVALKVLYPSVTLHAKAVGRFRREAQAAGRLHHTNIVPVYGMGEEAGSWFYAMERIHGRTLADVVGDLRRIGGRRETPAAGTPPTPFTSGGAGRTYFERVAHAFAALAEGLEHAHAAGVLHRDLKPSNVLIDRDGTLKITDFGLARLEGEVGSLTVTGELLGTPAYMSPEQVLSKPSIDGRTDVYSLGATLYELLTLHPPVEGATSADVFAAILAKDPVPPRRFSARIPKDLETIVLKTLEKDPPKRYRSAGDLARDLRLFVEGAAIRARRTGLLVRAARRVRRHKARTALVAVTLALVASVTWLAVDRRRDAERRRSEAYESLLREADEAEWLGLVPSRPDASLGSRDPDARRARLERVERAIALDPDRPEAHIQRAVLSRDLAVDVRLGELDRVARWMGPRWHHFARGHVLRLSGRPSDATREEDVAWTHPPTERLGELLSEAGAWTVRGDRPRAIGTIDRLLRIPGLPGSTRSRALYARAEARRLEGDLAGAVEDLAAARDPGGRFQPDLAVRIASLWRRLGRPDLAEASIEGILKEGGPVETRSDWESVCRSLSDCRELAWLAKATSRGIALHPGDATLWYFRSFALRSSDRRAALDAAEQALRLDPGLAAAWLAKAAVLQSQGDLDAARAAVERHLTLRPHDASGVTLLGSLLISLGRTDDGLAHLRRAAVLDPHSHGTHCTAAQILRRSGRLEEAFEAAQRALELDPTCPLCHYSRGMEMLRRGSPADALAEGDRTVAFGPELAHGHSLRADALRALDRLEDSLRAAERGVAADSTEAYAHATHAMTLDRLGRTEHALAAIEKALEIDPKDRSYLTYRVFFLSRLERWEDLVRRFDEDFGEGQDDMFRFVHRALVVLGRAPEAVARAERRADASPQDVSIRWLRNEALLAAGRFEDAAARAREAAAELPAARSGFVGQEIVALRMGRKPEDAAALARRIVEEGVDAHDPHDLWFLAVAGDVERVRKEIERLPPPDSATSEGARAALHALVGESESAIAWLSRAVEHGFWIGYRDPDFAPLASDPRYLALERRMLGR
jgi:tetratricopeptide (TPR) repeat protein